MNLRLALTHGVVVRVSGPGDRPLDPEGGQERVDPGVAGLRPAVRVEHLDRGERELDVREGGLHEQRVLAPAAGAAHDLPVVQVDEQADVAPARPGAHVGEVGRHVGARAVAVEAPAERVGGVGQGGGARGPRAAPGIRAGQAVLPRYPAYPAPGGRYPRPRERHLEPAGAVAAFACLAERNFAENLGEINQALSDALQRERRFSSLTHGFVVEALEGEIPLPIISWCLGYSFDNLDGAVAGVAVSFVLNKIRECASKRVTPFLETSERLDLKTRGMFKSR